MKIGPFGPLEIAIILIVILILFGPKNLPKLGTAIGKAVKNLREGMSSGKKAKQTKTEKAATATEEKAEPEKAEASVQEEPQEAEVVAVIDKPKPGQKAEAAAAEKQEA